MAQRSPKIGSLPWEDEAPEESRFRRVQQVSPRTGRTLPGMPVDMDPDEDEELPRKRRRYDAPRPPWYRPEGKLGRVLLASGAVLLLASATTAVLSVKNLLERDGRFRIAGTANIQAVGLSHVPRADILPVFGADIGKNIFFIHLSERRRQLEQIPWIQSATVMRVLPDQIRVSIVERKPIAFVREGQQIELVDADGVVLTMSPEAITRHHYSFPVVTGIDPRDPAASRRTRMAVYRRLIDDLDSAGQHLSRQISEIDLTDPEDARVLMEDDPTLLHFGDDQFLARYQRYKAHIAEWRQQYPQLSAIDLRYDNQVVLKMGPGAAAGTTAVSTGDGGATAITAPDSTATAAAKPSAASPANAGAKPVRPEHKSGHNARPQHKAQSHHKPKTKSAVEREKERRAAARKAALLHRQRTSSINANRQGQ